MHAHRLLGSIPTVGCLWIWLLLAGAAQGAPAAQGASSAQASIPAEESIPAEASTPAQGPLPTLAFPGSARGDLEIPAELWEGVRARVDARGRMIGYTAAEMAYYGRSALLLPTVLQLFADARTVPRFAGRISDDLLADAGKVAAFGYGWSDGGLGEIAARCYGLLAASTGRRTMPDTLAAETPFTLQGPAAASWRALPQPVRDLVSRLYRAAEAVRPWLLAAYDRELLARIAGAADLADVATADLCALAMAHQTEERFDQLASLDPATFELFETADLAYLGYASVVWLRYLEFALQAFHAAGGPGELAERAIPTLRFATPLGEILIGGTGDDDHRDPAFLAIDLGGDDRYGPGFGASRSLGSPVALLLDLTGNDRYGDAAGPVTAPGAEPADGPSAAAGTGPGAEPADGPSAVVPSFGAGVFGIGALCDLGGDDAYVAPESGLGCGCFGTGLLVDFGGNDAYHGDRWTQGAAHGGIGVLLDLAGDDVYSCAQQSQGLGATLGTGLLLDLAGHDRYIARDDGNISELYLGQSVAMSQGCGYGRRADLGDGHSLAGGFGLLIDGAGDDDYHAQVWAQGCGYWWGVGLLEDRAGNDRYRNGKYSSGAAAHFAIGVHVDLSGNDLYNSGNETAKNQFQGHARDGSLGIFIDGEGDDCYELRSHCAGSGDLGSIGLFWDRRGDDRYHHAADPASAAGSDPWGQTPPLGSTTQYEVFRSFRDDLPVYGIFLDTQGRDTYETGGRGANNDVWSMRRNPNAWGLGLDAECYPAAPR